MIFDGDLSYSTDTNDEQYYAFANKLFNPFGLRDLEANSHHFDNDPDIRYHNTI